MSFDVRRTRVIALALVSVMGCIPAEVVGSLRHEEDERERLLVRARGSGLSVEVLNAIVPPLTPSEEKGMQAQDSSCRASYLWKNGLSWTGGGLIAVAAGSTIIGGVATGYNATFAKVFFGISGGTLAALGGIMQVVAGIIQTGFADRGCVVRDTPHLPNVPSQPTPPAPVPVRVPAVERYSARPPADVDAGGDGGARTPPVRTWGWSDDSGDGG
jgi:hypothetical protein